jgi:hypothetical protein
MQGKTHSANAAMQLPCPRAPGWLCCATRHVSATQAHRDGGADVELLEALRSVSVANGLECKISCASNKVWARGRSGGGCHGRCLVCARGRDGHNTRYLAVEGERRGAAMESPLSTAQMTALGEGVRRLS